MLKQVPVQAAASKVAWCLPISTISKQREDMENLCVDILTAYRKHCAARSSNEGQLILPESLKLLPLYMCMFFKSQPLTAGPPDGRAAVLAAHVAATPRRFAMMVKPRLVDVQVRAGNPLPSTAMCRSPPPGSASPTR